MSGPNDATIKLLYPVDDGLFFAVDAVPSNTRFQVVANVEVGSNIMQSVDRQDVRVAIHNLMDGSTTVASAGSLLADSVSAHLEEIRVDFPNGVKGSDGDVLQAVASYTVIAGVNTDISVETSEYFIIGSARN